MHWESTVKELTEKSNISENLANHITTLTQILEQLSAERSGEEFIKILGEFPLNSKEALDGGNQEMLKRLRKLVEDMPGKDIKEYLRIYTTFFHLVNSLNSTRSAGSTENGSLRKHRRNPVMRAFWKLFTK